MTRTELGAALASTLILLSVASVIAEQDDIDPRTTAARIKDGTQIRLIHQAMVVFAHENIHGQMPTPGLVNRLADPYLGQQIPGRAPEDTSANTTANLYSLLIVMNYISPEVAVSPLERSPNVAACDDYDYDAYAPMDDVYWWDGFHADLSGTSYASYAHLVMHGERKQTEWRNSANARYPVIGSRGPFDGKGNHESVTCGPFGRWHGHLCFNDNHVEFLDTMTPEGLTCRVNDAETPDNVFAMQTGPDGADAILSFTRAMGEDGPELQHD